MPRCLGCLIGIRRVRTSSSRSQSWLDTANDSSAAQASGLSKATTRKTWTRRKRTNEDERDKQRARRPDLRCPPLPETERFEIGQKPANVIALWRENLRQLPSSVA